MRLTIGFLLLILLMYLGGATIVAARSQSLIRAWHGEGNGQTIHFSMPSGPLPGVVAKPWRLGYRLSCTGLKHRHDMPPNTYLRSTFSFSLTGSQSLGSGVGMEGSANMGHGGQSFHFGNGGTFTLTITARPTCIWTVTAASD